jgi:nucleoid DNA-binding protein
MRISNPLLDRAIDDVSVRLGIPKHKIDAAIKHEFNWIREVICNKEYSSILMNGFGSFSIIEKRYEKFINYKNDKDTETNPEIQTE